MPGDEAYDECRNRIVWLYVDQIVFVANKIKKSMADRFPHVMKLMDGKTEVVNNGVDIENIELLSPGHGLNIAVVGSITHKKNPAMVLQILKDVQERIPVIFDDFVIAEDGESAELKNN